MVIVLRVIGWVGISIFSANGAIKLFGSDAAVREFSGGDRDLDLNISVIAFCLIFLALAAILAELRAQRSSI